MRLNEKGRAPWAGRDAARLQQHDTAWLARINRTIQRARTADAQVRLADAAERIARSLESRR